jgi:hypothetical protein
VNNWNNTSEKYIYNANAGTASTQVIKLYLDTTAPTLYCKLSGLGNNANPVIKVTENFPIQKWVYVVISVDSQIADCYLDGKLIKSTKLPYLVVQPPLTLVGLKYFFNPFVVVPEVLTMAFCHYLQAIGGLL